MTFEPEEEQDRFFIEAEASDGADKIRDLLLSPIYFLFYFLVKIRLISWV